MQKEIWKDVKGSEGIYKVSNIGNIKSLTRKRKVRGGGFRIVKCRILKKSLNNTGYYRVNLKNITSNTQLIHRIVAVAFIPNPENKRTINHKNGVKTDNNVENLEWATDRENINHAFRTGLNKHSLANVPSYVTRKTYQYDLNFNFMGVFDSVTKASISSGVHNSDISRCARGLKSSAGGFKWSYNKLYL